MVGITTLFSGSSGNCSLIRNGGRLALIDAGVSASAVIKAVSMLRFDPEAIEAVFVTHEHVDHVSGIRVLCKKLPRIRVFMTAGTEKGFATDAFSERIEVVSAGVPTEAIGLSFTPFRTYHDAIESVGYTVEKDGERVLGYATDTGRVDGDMLSRLAGCRTVVIESNHDFAMLMTGAYPYPLKRRIASDTGHLSNEDCAAAIGALCESGTRNFILAHLSRENNLPILAAACAENAARGRARIVTASPASPSEEMSCLV